MKLVAVILEDVDCTGSWLVQVFARKHTLAARRCAD